MTAFDTAKVLTGMSKCVDPFLRGAAAAMALGLLLGGGACSSDLGRPPSIDGAAGSGGAPIGGTGGRQATGGSGGGSIADTRGGGAIGSSGGATGNGGTAGSGGTTTIGGAGGSARGTGGGAGAPDARPADAAMATDGSAARGGSGSGGAGNGGRTGSGGSGPDAAADAGPDAFLARDVAIPDARPIPDAPPIPDLPVKQDAAPSFWQEPFAANCTPPAIGGRAQSDGHHRPGEDCMRSGCHLNPGKPEHHAGTDCRGSGCHSNGSPDGTGAPAFLWGGTVYRAVTLAADRGVEVAVRSAQGFYTACSAANGNFWVVAPTGTKTLTWTGASTRLRNANGEAPMMTTPAAGCNASTCHTGPLKMTSP